MPEVVFTTAPRRAFDGELQGTGPLAFRFNGTDVELEWRARPPAEGAGATPPVGMETRLAARLPDITRSADREALRRPTAIASGRILREVRLPAP